MRKPMCIHTSDALLKCPACVEAEGAQAAVEPLVMPWRRYRFTLKHADPRPVKFPPPGPYWVTGYAPDRRGDEWPILVAYLPVDGQIHDWWPEAEQVDTTEEAEITFTDRFPKPSWWA